MTHAAEAPAADTPDAPLGGVPASVQPASAGRDGAGSRRRLTAWERARQVIERGDAILGLAMVWVCMLLVQNASQDVIGIDGYFHIKLARLMWEQGIKVDFPYLPLTILNPRDFTDHHLLYHIALMPFALGDLRVGGKLAGLLYGVAGVFSAYWLMARLRVRYPLFWLLALLASAEWFLARMSMTRRQSLSLLLLMVAIWLLLTRRYRWLALVGFLYAWLFDGFVLLVAVTGIAFLARLIAERRLDWPIAGWTLLGIGVALVTNPYFPNNIYFTIQHILPKLQPEPDINVGTEWSPYSLEVLLRTSWLSILLLPLGLLPATLRVQRAWRDPRLLILAGLAVLFVGLYVRHRRFIEYSPAFAVVLAGYTWTYYSEEIAQAWSSFKARLAGRAAGGSGLRRRLPTAASTLLVLGLLGGLGWQANYTVRAAMRQADDRADRYERYREASQYIAANSAPLAPIFHTEWSEFPELFFHNSHNTYMVGLDPMYMVQADRERYLLWRRITRGQLERPSSAIRDVFGAEWVVTNRVGVHARFIEMADRDPLMERVFETPRAVVYRVMRP